jgi:Uma2 family endonuclease
MSVATQISIEEYLGTVYRPDCDYVDGVVEERNLGEYDHSNLQGALIAFFRTRGKRLGIRALPEQRVQVSATRFRIPDVCLLSREHPIEQIVHRPPLLVIEVLSPEDRVRNTQIRVDDFLKMGAPEVWVIDPQDARAWVHTAAGVSEAPGGVLRFRGEELNLASLLED